MFPQILIEEFLIYLGVEDRVVSPSTSFRINEVEPPRAGVRGILLFLSPWGRGYR
jgi:hypothetical protein